MVSVWIERHGTPYCVPEWFCKEYGKSRSVKTTTGSVSKIKSFMFCDPVSGFGTYLENVRNGPSPTSGVSYGLIG